ncbi:AAA family ATPase [Streptomyces sp. NPDC088725]|uniref:AAA family ATPase n=1 Tax=Streptomyces sp. NPDC088725 TaxID=3365873 RepID=UPI003814E938
MNDRGAEDIGATHNSVSGNAVVAGPLVMASRIESLVMPPSAPTAPPSQVPLPNRVFVNRVAELTALRATHPVLATPDADPGGAVEPAPGPAHGPDIVLITGLGGVGKTQLVSQWVHQDLKRLYPEGQLYVDLEDARQDGAVDVADVLSGFLRALGVHKDYIPESFRERAALYRSITSGRALLVVVDNAHHAPEVRPLLPPDGLVVVTGRKSLPSLLMDGAVHITVDPLDEDAGVQLVRRWSSAAARSTAAELVRLCGGLPLALRAAGEWLAGRPHLGLDDVVRRLTAEERHALSQKPEGVDMIFDTVLAELPGHTRHLYGLLGALPGTTVTRPVAVAAGATRIDDALGDLVTAHLAVRVQDTQGPPRFRLHDVVRAHARKTASALPVRERVEALRSVTDFYLDATALADVAVLGGGRFRLQPAPTRTSNELSPSVPLFTTAAEALDWLDAERSNLLALLRLASKERWYDAVWKLCESLWALYHSRKHYADSIEAHGMGIEAAQWEGRRDAEVRMRNQLARAFYELGEYPRAEQELARADALLGQVSDTRLSGVVRETRGLIALDLGRTDEAYALFSQAKEDNAQVPDQHGVVVQSYNIGQALVAGGRWQEALDVLAEAMSLAERTGDQAMRPRIGIVRARALSGLGLVAEAVESAGSAAVWAAGLEQRGKLDQALALLADLAGRTDDERLKEISAERLRELRRNAGVLARTD